MSLALPKPEKATRRKVKIDYGDMPLGKLDPARDSNYKAFVRAHPCAIKGRAGHRCYGPVECAHIGISGMGIKASDYATLPLCQRAHRISGEGTRSQHSYGWADFIVSFDLNPWHVAFLLLEKWHRMAVDK